MGYFIHYIKINLNTNYICRAKLKTNKQTAEHLIPPKSQGEDNMMEPKRKGSGASDDFLG